ncbi:conserved phage C-terminal domain-containing protein [Glaesserella parasuis]|uniref:conserved phage C-terminal domain-containing protein n=1 Tax=Glaesserella parasuis TaxID=738 RepID=UPI00243676DF|nr:conserved phage C-terminal domain-containing protein [Glaesserella parasuis]MDG6310693.1 conserved phage C-terminal domain-containing protein [Glaesserella parasuis]
MRFTSTINNVRLVEWGINITQGALVDLINQASSWAKAVVIDGVTYYWMSFGKVCEELPAVFSKEDTVYRQYKVLKEKGIIEHFKMDGKDYVRLTEKGCEWNKFEPIRDSEKNPSVGNQSEPTRKKIRESSEKNPTDKYIQDQYNQDQNNPPVSPQGEPAPAEVVLNHLNNALAVLADELGERKPVGYTLKPWEKNISARVRESSVVDCQRVVDYLVARWGRDEKMSQYLCPSTIFRLKNFAAYLPKSIAWERKGRPICIKDKWMAKADVAKRLVMPTVDEVKSLYQKSLGFGNPFKSLDFSDKCNLVLYYATIGTKNKKPLERDLLAVIAKEINSVADRVDQLTVPTFN